jgi:hypothetical protein
MRAAPFSQTNRVVGLVEAVLVTRKKQFSDAWQLES